MLLKNYLLCFYIVHLREQFEQRSKSSLSSFKLSQFEGATNEQWHDQTRMGTEKQSSPSNPLTVRSGLYVTFCAGPTAPVPCNIFLNSPGYCSCGFLMSARKRKQK